MTNSQIDIARTLTNTPAIGHVLPRVGLLGQIEQLGVSALAIGGFVVAGFRARFRPGRAITVNTIRLRAMARPASTISATLWQATEQLAAVTLPAREPIGPAVALAASFAADDTLELRIGEGDGTAHGLFIDLLGTVAE